MLKGHKAYLINGGEVYKKYMIFKVFGVYLSEFLIFLHEIFFVSKIIPISCDKHQNFDCGCSRVAWKRGSKSRFLPFFDDFGHFLSSLFRHKPLD